MGPLAPLTEKDRYDMTSKYHYRAAAACFLAAAIITLSACDRHAKSSQGAHAAASPAAAVVAEVNGHQITQRDVDNQIGAPIYALEDKAYQMRKAALDKLIVDMLVEDEAKKSGVSVDEIKRHHGAAVIEVSD